VVGELNALPLYYIRQLLDVNVGDTGKAMTEFKTIVAEEYLSTILEKDNKIMNEMENIIFRSSLYDEHYRKIQSQ
jgi:hypothetical protein